MIRMRTLAPLLILVAACKPADQQDPPAATPATEPKLEPEPAPAPRPDPTLQARLVAANLQLTRASADLATTAEKAGGSLGELSDEQQRAVATLMVASYALGATGPGTSTGPSRELTRIWKALPAVREAPSMALACMDETIAYVSALSSCEEEDEKDCPDTWGPAGSLAECQLTAIQDLSNDFPWPPEPLGQPGAPGVPTTPPTLGAAPPGAPGVPTAPPTPGAAPPGAPAVPTTPPTPGAAPP